MPQDASPYPANAFYRNWNTNEHNPYHYDLWKKDSSNMLILVDTLWNCDFVVPFKGKNIIELIKNIDTKLIDWVFVLTPDKKHFAMVNFFLKKGFFL